MTPAEKLNIIATAVTAVATAVNSVFVVILVRVTKQYTRITGEILKESRKAAEASQAQANAAWASITTLKEQIADQLGLGRTVVQSAIQTAVKQIEYWKSQELSFSTSRTLPPTDTLVPGNASSAVEHARRLSPEGAQHLSGAFDDLRLARTEIEALKLAGKNWPLPGPFKSGFDSQKAVRFLEAAFTELQNAQKHLL